MTIDSYKAYATAIITLNLSAASEEWLWVK